MKKLLAVLLSGVSFAVFAGVNYKYPVPTGEHPRLMFTKADLPKIRARTKTTLGKDMVDKLKKEAAVLKRILAKKDAKSQNRLRLDVVNKFSKLQKQTRMAALLYILTGDKQYGELAKKVFVLWLDCLAKKGANSTGNWGEPEFSMVYDWIYDLLTPAERQDARKIFQRSINKDLVKLFDKVWWMSGPSATLRNSINWTPIFSSGIALTAMAVEGEVEVPDAIMEQSVKHMRNFLNNGIALDGAMYEGLTYPTGYGTDRTPYMLVALKLRGIDLINTTNVGKVPYWFAYEMLPWGGEGQAMNKGTGNFDSGTFTTYLASEFGGIANWIYYNAAGHDPGVDRTEPTIAFINGIPEKSPNPPADLPLSHHFSTNGKVICRSGWGPRDAHYVFCVTPLGAGHSHADQGTFCYADDGVNFAADSGVLNYASEEHNIIMIDGKGQAQVESSTESFIRSADFSGYADIIDADLKLGYERFLTGRLDGPWYWMQYNPVQKADRRSMFVRGVTGPFLVIADDFQKDDKVREYKWLLHSEVNNKITVDGRRFKIEERFGGKFLESLGPGLESKLAGDNPKAGNFHGWVLVRGVPYSRWWSNTTLKLNGKAVPYNTTYFQLGLHRQGWHWVPILPKGRKSSPVLDLPKGKLTVDLISKTGAQVAAAVFSRQYDWKPGFDLPENSKDFIVLKSDTAIHGKRPWKVLDDPRSELRGVFLGDKVPELKVVTSRVTGQPVLEAVVNDKAVKYLGVMAAVSSTRKRSLKMPIDAAGQSVVLHSSFGNDIVAGAISKSPTSGALKTDAVTAVVSELFDGRIKAYALMNGSMAAYKDKTLVKFKQGSGSVIFDGNKVVVRGTSGAELQYLNLKTGKLTNYKVPVLPNKWTMKKSKDGRLVEVTGDGPLPLAVGGASDAIDVKVNGVSRWFVKGVDGKLYPTLENGTECFVYKYAMGAKNIATMASGIKLTPAPGSKAPVAQISKSTTLVMENPVPAECNVTLNYYAAKPGKIIFKYNDMVKTVNIRPEQVGRRLSLNFAGLKLKGAKSKLNVTPNNGPVWLGKIIMNPQFERIVPEYWKIIGPFHSDWGRADGGEALVKQAMQAIYPPEKEIDLNAEYVGDSGKKVKWHDCKPEPVVRFDLDKGVTFRQIGIKQEKNHNNRKYTGRIGYAVTFIKSPDNRHAVLGIASDWWANAWVNGKKVVSERTKSLKENDASEFNADGILEAPIELKKGWNVLLVKNHGGTGGNRFVPYITNPGDLEFARRK